MANDEFREDQAAARSAGLKARHETRLMRYCKSRYEPDEPDDGRTHTCNLEADHDTKHHCPRCGNDWEASND
jgi:hypothetical protein